MFGIGCRRDGGRKQERKQERKKERNRMEVLEY